MIIKTTLFRRSSSFLLPVLLLLLLFSCGQEGNEGGEEARVREMAGGLPGGKAFRLDPARSQISWSIRKIDGSFLRGTFTPGKGYLLLEGNSPAAGFWEGDLLKDIRFTDSSAKVMAGGLQFLHDSLPQLFTPDGRRIRFDLRQTSRVIPKSEFRSLGNQDSLAPTHDFQFQAEIADSSQGLRLPLRLKMSAREVFISGHCQLNLREFGVLSRQVTNPSQRQWIPEASLEFRLFFPENP